LSSQKLRLSFSHLHLDVPKGYCPRLSRLSRRNLPISEDVKHFGSSVLPVLVPTWKAKEIMLNFQHKLDQISEKRPHEDSSWLEDCVKIVDNQLISPQCFTSIEIQKRRGKGGN
jgi:hypothetical protein